MGSRFALMVGGQPMGTHKKFIMYSHAFKFKEPSKALDMVFQAHDYLKPVRPTVWRQECPGQQRYISRDIREEAKKRGVAFRLIETTNDESKDAKAQRIDSIKNPMFNGEIYVHRSMKDLISEIQVYPNGLTVDLLDLLGQMFMTCFKRGVRQDLSPHITPRQAYSQVSQSRTGY